MASPPQPGLDRIEPVAGHPLVVGVVPGQAPLVVLTAATWAEAMSGSLVCAYVDPTRMVMTEHPDGRVEHAPVAVDGVDDSWMARETAVKAQVHAALAESEVAWQWRFLAGRADRALTHLARAVGAGAIVVGSRSAGRWSSARDFLEGSLAARLSHHQHRPVVVVPGHVVDWHGEAPWG
ncbi:hypothetical protein KEM60_01747 [Austwickia sp. TVS 96-490-7B]|uniref:universal stress protein n=1 Tax=Austwickia sp. TVS 96-490-7B TaxID=2830843 RepID=UPI001C56DA63|nr:universal stress protein [Austwickia sp. TVS 96-490-7B]MBW3085547.1 hypothetical protein [Austwickia sp. TVS 96-490-7B]